MKILVNTISTKKHSGGAFQISINFLLKSIEHQDIEWYYITSSDLDEVVAEAFQEIRGIRYFVFPTQPDFLRTYYRTKKQIKKLEAFISPDVVYTITAPSYFKFKAKEVMRFTNGMVTHPNKYSLGMLNLFQRCKNWLYCMNQKRLIRNTSFFITQTETTKLGISRITHLPLSHICVVHNVLPAIFSTIDRSYKVLDENWIDIACIGNPVPHKNFDIIPDVLLNLKKKGISNVRFHLTIPTDHPLDTKIRKALGKINLEHCYINHGRVTQRELANVYNRCKLAFLPTLLEVFSASTIEAMFFKLPCVASDFAFNTEVFEDSCLYFEPKNALDASEKIIKLIKDENLRNTLVNRMNARLSMYGNYDNHFRSIKSFLLKVCNNEI